MSNAAIEEPKPIQTEYSEPVLPFVMLQLLISDRAVLGADLEARAKMGVERYGTLLMTHNGRDALADLYQELLDALMYLGQYELETEAPMDFEFDRLKHVAIQVKRLMGGELEDHWPNMPDLPDGIDRFAQYPIAGEPRPEGSP